MHIIEVTPSEAKIAANVLRVSANELDRQDVAFLTSHSLRKLAALFDAPTHSFEIGDSVSCAIFDIDEGIILDVDEDECTATVAEWMQPTIEVSFEMLELCRPRPKGPSPHHPSAA